MDPKPWLATYRENGIPAEIDADAYPSVVHLLDAAMTKFADKPAFRSYGQTLSYADVDRLSGAFAAWLQKKLGVKRGDRIAVMVPNVLAFPIAFLGIARAGGVQVNVNPMYTPRELEHQLNDSGSEDHRHLQRFDPDAGRGGRQDRRQDGDHRGPGRRQRRGPGRAAGGCAPRPAASPSPTR